MEKYRILVFTTSYHPFIGGAEIAIQEICRRLKDRFDFYIVTSRFRRDLPKREIGPEGVIIRLGFGTPLDKWFFPLFCIGPRFSTVLYQTLYQTRFGTDGFLGVDIGMGALTAAILKIFKPRVPFIFNIQYGYGEERLKWGRLGLIGLAFRFILSRADYVTAISTHLLELARKYGYKGMGEVIHNGVDIQKFKIQNSKFPINPKPQIPNPKIIITTSRLVPKNGIDTLIHAIAEVKKQIPDIQGWIIGDGPEKENYKLQITNYKLEGNVKLLGEIPHNKIPEYLHRADIFVRPSRSEGMGNSFVEALAAGLPIIGTPVGGITDIIQDGKTGLFAKVDDLDDLAKKIIQLLKDKKLAASIVKHGRRMIEKQFSWDRIAQKYELIFVRHRELNKLSTGNGQLPVLTILIATPLYPPEIGGPATYSKILAENLPKYGFKVEILAFREVRHLPKVIRHLTYFLKTFWRGKRADIIFAQDPVSVGLPAILAAKILRKTFILKIVGDYAWEQGAQRFGVRELLDDFLNKKYGWRVEFLRKIENFTARRARFIIVPSEYLKKIVLAWGIDAQKIKVIPNAYEGSLVKFSKSKARKKLVISGTVLISAGRLVPWKGFDTLIELAAELKLQIPDLKLYIIGSGPQEALLKKRTAELNLEDFVIFTGQKSREELLAYLRAGDVFILNSAYEGFSHLLLEAVAAKIPIVTSARGGNSEIIENGVEGILVRFNDRSALKDAVLKILQDADFSSVLTRRALKRLQRFSKTKVTAETVKVLKLII